MSNFDPYTLIIVALLLCSGHAGVYLVAKNHYQKLGHFLITSAMLLLAAGVIMDPRRSLEQAVIPASSEVVYQPTLEGREFNATLKYMMGQARDVRVKLEEMDRREREKVE